MRWPQPAAKNWGLKRFTNGTPRDDRMTDDPFKDPAGKPRRLRGMAILSNSPWVAELAPKVGFELVWFDMEHGSLGFAELGQLCQAAELAGGITLARTADAQRTSILRALEVGAQFILVPMIEDEEQAKDIVRNAKYPPVGNRGFSSRSRGAGYGLEPIATTLKAANARTQIFALIETQKGVENVAAICAVPGLDGIFLGPGDLSFELGTPGEFASPVLIEMVTRCIETAHTAGKKVGMFSAPGPVLSAALAAGLDVAVPGADIGYLVSGWKALLETIPCRQPSVMATARRKVTRDLADRG
jgi:4-hydroxy-2-oxoheptanedioate aldolase